MPYVYEVKGARLIYTEEELELLFILKIMFIMEAIHTIYKFTAINTGKRYVYIITKLNDDRTDRDDSFYYMASIYT